jgi:hypothetical protein
MPTLPPYRTPAERRTTTQTLRLYKDQLESLNFIYPAKSSLIVRLLLDRFLKGQLPQVEEDYLKLK